MPYRLETNSRSFSYKDRCSKDLSVYLHSFSCLRYLGIFVHHLVLICRVLLSWEKKKKNVIFLSLKIPHFLAFKEKQSLLKKKFVNSKMMLLTAFENVSTLMTFWIFHMWKHHAWYNFSAIQKLLKSLLFI